MVDTTKNISQILKYNIKDLDVILKVLYIVLL